MIKKVSRFILTAIGLGVTGFAFAAAGGFLGGRIIGRGAAGFGALGLAIFGILAGYTAGIIIGLISLKKLFHQRGSLLLGVIGAVIGAVVPLVLAEPLNLSSNANLLFGVFFLSVPLFSLAGFYLKR